MSRLYDRIMHTAEAWKDDPEFQEDFPELTCIVADNVAQYTFDNKDTIPRWDNHISYGMPFDRFFIELSRPVNANHLPFTWGLEVRREETWAHMQYRRAVAKDTSPADEIVDRWDADTLKRMRDKSPDTYFCTLWLQKDVSSIPTDGLAFNLMLNDSKLTDWSYGYSSDHAYLGTSDKWMPADHEHMRRVLDPIFMAIALMSCKNVEVIDHAPLPNVQKLRIKGKSFPLVRYKVIKVNSMRTVKHFTDLDSIGSPISQSNAELPLSMWRGHFKDYRDGKGLFGKYKGVYWWDQHVRGSIENGAIVKDYDVQAPKDD